MTRLARLLLGTGNPNKVREFAEILAPLGIAAEPGYPPDAAIPDETGADYDENALLKARHVLRYHPGAAVFADDSGLSVDALDGAPGLHSHRFGGFDLPFAGKIAKVLEYLDGVPDGKRTARFHCAIALLLPGRDPEAFHATCEGRIAHAPAGGGGFGFDPVFIPDGFDRSFAELPPEAKHAVSHRGRAAAKLVARLKELEARG